MIVVSPILRIIAKILSFILFALTILAGYSGRIDPDFFTFPVILVLMLPYLAIASFVVAAAWLVGRRFITGAIGMLAIIAAWAPISNAVPLSFSAKPDPDAVTFKLLTYNIVHGWDQTQGMTQSDHSGQQGNAAFKYVMDSGADIVCLQEVMRWRDEEIPNISQLLDSLDRIYPYRLGNNVSDTKVLSKYPIEIIPPTQYVKGKFDPRSYTFYRVNIKGHKMTLVNFHFISIGLAGDEVNVVTDIRSVNGAKESISELKGSIRHKIGVAARKRKKEVGVLRDALTRIEGPLLLCGDLNDVPESYAYRLLRGEDLHDAYVDTGFGPLVTFNQHMFWFHLDQIFYRGGLKALSVKKGDVKFSDHYPLMAEFEFAPESGE